MAVISNRTSNNGAVSRDFKSLCKGPILETVQDSYNSGSTKNRMSGSSSGAWRSLSPVLSRDKGLRQPQLTSTPTNLLSSSSKRLKDCMLPPSYVRHDASPQLLSSFYWGSVASDDAFAYQSSALDRNCEGRRLKIGDNWSYAPPKFLATPLFQICEITRNSEKVFELIAVQGHPRSSTLVQSQAHMQLPISHSLIVSLDVSRTVFDIDSDYITIPRWLCVGLLFWKLTTMSQNVSKFESLLVIQTDL